MSGWGWWVARALLPGAGQPAQRGMHRDWVSSCARARPAAGSTRRCAGSGRSCTACLWSRSGPSSCSQPAATGACQDYVGGGGGFGCVAEACSASSAPDACCRAPVGGLGKLPLLIQRAGPDSGWLLCMCLPAKLWWLAAAAPCPATSSSPDDPAASPAWPQTTCPPATRASTACCCPSMPARTGCAPSC